MVLAEPPAMSLLNYMQGDYADSAKKLFKDIQQRMVNPMQGAFRSGNSKEGVKIFVNYVLRDSLAWQNMSPQAKKETMVNVTEWNVILTKGDLFPEITASQIHSIKVPVLLLSGDKTYAFLTLIDKELHELLPDNKQVIFKEASHRMWYEKPEECREAVIEFLSSH